MHLRSKNIHGANVFEMIDYRNPASGIQSIVHSNRLLSALDRFAINSCSTKIFPSIPKSLGDDIFVITE